MMQFGEEQETRSDDMNNESDVYTPSHVFGSNHTFPAPTPMIPYGEKQDKQGDGVDEGGMVTSRSEGQDGVMLQNSEGKVAHNQSNLSTPSYIFGSHHNSSAPTPTENIRREEPNLSGETREEMIRNMEKDEGGHDVVKLNQRRRRKREREREERRSRNRERCGKEGRGEKRRRTEHAETIMRKENGIDAVELFSFNASWFKEKIFVVDIVHSKNKHIEKDIHIGLEQLSAVRGWNPIWGLYKRRRCTCINVCTFCM